MRWRVGFFLAAFCFLSTNVSAATIHASGSSNADGVNLVQTLIGLGHTVVNSFDPTVDLVISVSGASLNDSGLVPYIQIGDWGSSPISNSWVHVGQNAVVNIDTNGAAHPLLDFVDSTWTTGGFHRYNSDGRYIGNATSGTGFITISANGTVLNNALAVDGDSIYIGWGAYGQDADINDLQILSNSINYLIGEQTVSLTAAPVPLPPALLFLVFGLLGLGFVGRKRS